MKRLIASFAALLAVACLLSACGQKGPLFLPDDSKGPNSAPGSHTHQQSS
ncbi:lipoprotein [Pseudomonas sp. NPDC007930]